MKKVIVATFGFIFLFSFVLPVLAASNTFYNRAKQAYDYYCKREEVPIQVAMGCYTFDKVAELEQRILTNEQLDSSQSAKLTELENRIKLLESTPTPSPTPIATNKITVNSDESFAVPQGIESITISLKNVNSLPTWAPTVSFDGFSYHEQHRFSGSQLDVTIPVIGQQYKINKGGSIGFQAEITFNDDPNSKVLLLSQSTTYPYLSDEFDTNGYSKIIITAGGGDNPQRISALTLLKPSTNGGYINQDQIVCDGGAQCPLQELNVDGSVYRIRFEGSGTNGILAALLKN